MAINTDADAIHFLNRPRERTLAKALDEAFDVAHGRPFDDLSVWLADAKPHTRERFGLTRETLVVYSKFETPDARVLRLINQVFNDTRYKDRADPTLVLVIHEGDPHHSQLFEEQVERVLVTFSADELLDSSKGSLFLRVRIAQRLGTADLFGVSSPVETEAKFFGRQALAEQLAIRLSARHENAGIFGLRKTGKTSLLRAIERRAQAGAHVAVYMDCENPGLYQARWWDLLQQVTRRFAAKLDNSTLDRNDKYTEQDAGLRFAADLTRLRLSSAQTFILLMDEVEYITPGVCGARARHWDEDFILMWQVLRAVQQENPGLFTFCLVGVNPACVEQTHFDVTPNPLFQLAQPIYLDPLPADSVRSMVRTVGRYSGLRFEEPVFKYLTERFGGHAYLIRLACSEVWRATKQLDAQSTTTVSVADFILFHSHIKLRLAQPVKDILLSLVWWYPDEYDLLRVLAEGDGAFVRQYMEDDPESLVQFARYGLVDADSGRFLVPELKDFLIEAGERYKTEVSPFVRSELPPQLLPEVPDLVLLSELFQYKATLEIWLRRVIVAYLGMRTGFNDHMTSTRMLAGLPKSATRPDPASLFTGRAPRVVVDELFLPDLGRIVSANWEDFAATFESKTKFQSAIDEANIARRVDAHTKPVSPEVQRGFKSAYEWLLLRLEKVPVELLGGAGLPPLRLRT